MNRHPPFYTSLESVSEFESPQTPLSNISYVPDEIGKKLSCQNPFIVPVTLKIQVYRPAVLSLLVVLYGCATQTLFDERPRVTSA